MEDPEPAPDYFAFIPLIVLGYVVLVLSIGGWKIFDKDLPTAYLQSACCGFLFLPLYAVVLASRFKDGTLNGDEAAVHILTFMGLLGFCVLMMGVAGMGSPA